MPSFGWCHPCRSAAMRRLIVGMTTLALAVLAAFGPAGAQSYPAKPIRVIVPFVAGGAVDVLARLVSAKMSESIGQPVIIENRAGAAGNVAADAVAKSPPDGYTILQNTNGQAISPSLYKSLPFDAIRDFTPVTQLVASQLLLVASPSLPAKSVQELIALAIPGARRSPALPQVPTIAESGLPGFESSSWQGWFVPANTPREIVALIQREAAKALNAPDVRERMEATANEVVASTPDAF